MKSKKWVKVQKEKDNNADNYERETGKANENGRNKCKWLGKNEKEYKEDYKHNSEYKGNIGLPRTQTDGGKGEKREERIFTELLKVLITTIDALGISK